MQLKARPCVNTLTRYPPWLRLHCLLLLQPLYTQTGPWLHCCYCYSACLQLLTFTLWCPRSSDCSSAVVLEMHACVGRDQHLCCLLFPPRHQHVCAFISYSGWLPCTCTSLLHTLYTCLYVHSSIVLLFFLQLNESRYSELWHKSSSGDRVHGTTNVV